MEFVSYTDWSQLPESAATLFARTAGDSVFFSGIWFENLLNHAPTDRRSILLASVVENGEVLALLPLEMRSGQHWYALTHLYSSLYTLLMAEQGRREVIECLATGLSRMPFASLRIDPIAADDVNLQVFQQAMESLGIDCLRRFRFYNWIHRTQGQSFHEYMEARPARVRNSIVRKERKLAREHGYTIALFTSSGLQQAMADYETVYRRSWKAHELHGDFVAGLAHGLFRQGWARLAILYVADTPVAAQFWFLAHGRASIFKLAYDESWKRYSPGSILTKYLMKHVIDEDKALEIDFLTGNDAYKQDWMSERRERWSLYCINNSPPKVNGRAGKMLKWLLGLK